MVCGFWVLFILFFEFPLPKTRRAACESLGNNKVGLNGRVAVRTIGQRQKKKIRATPRSESNDCAWKQGTGRERDAMFIDRSTSSSKITPNFLFLFTCLHCNCVQQAFFTVYFHVLREDSLFFSSGKCSFFFICSWFKTQRELLRVSETQLAPKSYMCVKSLWSDYTGVCANCSQEEACEEGCLGILVNCFLYLFLSSLFLSMGSCMRKQR